jgi:putative DNA-invertase from lambdoid prophage Rac
VNGKPRGPRAPASRIRFHARHDNRGNRGRERRLRSVPVQERLKCGPLFAKLEKGDIVIAAKLDRLFRSALDALNVVASLKERGVFLHLLDLGGDIAGNGLSELFLTIAAAFAEAERDRIRERISQSKADQKARGRYLGGKIPFGCCVGPDGETMVEVEAEQAATREMIRLRIEERRPLRVVVEAMAKRGHAISHQSVVNIVKRQANYLDNPNSGQLDKTRRLTTGPAGVNFSTPRVFPPSDADATNICALRVSGGSFLARKLSKASSVTGGGLFCFGANSAQTLSHGSRLGGGSGALFPNCRKKSSKTGPLRGRNCA